MLNILLALVLSFSPQSITVNPNVVNIPNNQSTAGTWPNFDPTKVGYKTFDITYDNGPVQFNAGDYIDVFFGYALKDGGKTNNPHYLDAQDFIVVPNDGTKHSPVNQFQISSPTLANFTTVTAPLPVNLSLVSLSHNSENVLRITFPNGLPINSVVDILFGDTSQGSPGAEISWNPGRPRIVVLETHNGITAPSTATMPLVLFTGEIAEAFVVNAPPVVEVGQLFSFSVEAVQNRGLDQDTDTIPVEDFTGTVDFDCPQTDATFPGSSIDRIYSRNDRAYKHFNCVFSHTGPHIIRVNADNNNNKFPAGTISSLSLSNTIWVVPPGERYHIYVGDLHRHSCEGGHAAIPDWMAWRELYNRGDDFGSVVEHSQLFFAGWQHANNGTYNAQMTYDPSESFFIAFPGYEYGLVGEHRQVIYKSITPDLAIADGPYHGGESPAPMTALTLNDFFTDLAPVAQSVPRICIPHHPLWNKSDFPNVPYEWGPNQSDPLQPVMEIYSIHGSSERYIANPTPNDYVMSHDVNLQRPPNEAASISDALSLNYVMGIIGSSDRHGYSEYEKSLDDSSGPYARPGLALVYGDMTIPNLRDRIWDGIMKRHTYATTGVRIYLDFRIDDNTIMGDMINAPAPVVFQIHALPAGLALYNQPSFTDLFIYRDGTTEVAHISYGPSQYNIVQSWADNNPIHDGQYHSYYVKIIQNDGQIAWSSPIWWSQAPK